ncbi:uncharacterized protein LOC110027709 [Phalaenopsis equestris]|uniref:uncharacterized protein LOC110027709 n=1 Tax=Phalaenopsis equestris TaxID=78828 RepID=UPI0009E35966|nr:uncharacterized protein LOC110027709 [Phalaenopsis equestris]
MEFAKFEEIGSSSSSMICLCRICHEEEEEEATSMESPCACSGTLKFAHRRCIQRWCDEKGSTICEICLRKFEPGYTVTAPSPSKPHMIEVVITIRGSLEAARLNNELQNQATEAGPGKHKTAEGSPSSYHTSSCFQSVALMLTMLFFLRHIVAVILAGNDYYSFRFFFIYLLRAVGVLLPFYLMLQLINIIINAKKLQRLHVSSVDFSKSFTFMATRKVKIMNFL